MAVLLPDYLEVSSIILLPRDGRRVAPLAPHYASPYSTRQIPWFSNKLWILGQQGPSPFYVCD